MNKSDFVAKLAEKTGMTKTDAQSAVDATLDVITEALASGDDVRFTGFGNFVVANRAAGEVRNPRTGEMIRKPASKAPKFKPGKALKDAVNK